MTDELREAKIQFGLRAQGHIPLIEKMLQEHCTWEVIAKALGWEKCSTMGHYILYLRAALRSAEEENKRLRQYEDLALSAFSIIHNTDLNEEPSWKIDRGEWLEEMNALLDKEEREKADRRTPPDNETPPSPEVSL